MDFKGGRKPPVDKPKIKFSQILKVAPIPPHQAEFDNLSAFTAWDIRGNDQYGDCVAADAANQVALITTALGGATYYPSLQETLDFYKTQNPGFPTQDDGMVMQDAFSTLVKVGIGTKKALAFASVDVKNKAEVDAAIALFGYISVGINFRANNMTEFDNGQSWDYDSTSTDQGGHAVLVGGVWNDTTKEYDFVTWGKETTLTGPFWVNQVEEAWVTIFEEHLGNKEFLAGVDVNALASYYQDLTGTPFPSVVPAPIPAPPPAPVPDPTPTPPPIPVTPPAPVPVPVPPAPGSQAEVVMLAKQWIETRWHDGRIERELKRSLNEWITDNNL